MIKYNGRRHFKLFTNRKKNLQVGQISPPPAGIGVTFEF